MLNVDDSYEIIDMTNLLETKYLLEILQANEDLDIDDDSEIIREETKPSVEKPEQKKIVDKDILIKLGLITTGIILVFLVISFLFKGSSTNKTNKEVSNKETDVEVTSMEKIPVDSNSNLALGNDSEKYLTIKGVLDLSVSANDTLSVKLMSSLEKGAIVKIGIFCGDNSEYKYITTDKDGKGDATFPIPSTWGDEKVTVGAYLKFDEPNYLQPSTITDKYGKNGEYISWTQDSPDMICYATVNHSNALVIALKEQQEKELAQQLATTIKRDFATIDTRVDAFGNIKHVPAGYSFDETNITEAIHIYPMIYYDVNTNTSYFYIICGYVGTQYYRFSSIGFSADGYNWTYDNGTNPKKNQVVGNKKAEWVYFNNVDSPVLLGDMGLLANSNKVTLSLVGSINKTYDVSSEELAQVKQFLYIYETYYGNGTIVPKTSWFTQNGTTIKLNYIQNPVVMYERGSKEIDSMKALSDKVSNARKNGEAVDETDANTLEIMNKTFRTVSDSMQSKIIDMVQSAEGITLFNDDYETNKNYMKIYFTYKDSNQTIESGYVPYINVYDDCTVIVPIRTITTSTNSYDEVYARFTISESLYNELEMYFNNKNYEQID